MIVIVFRSRLRPEAEAEYYPLAQHIHKLAEQTPGFLSLKTFQAPDGERVSVVEFDNEDNLRAWREHPEHVEAQRRGRAEFYSEYHIQTCSVIRQYSFHADR